MRRRLYEPHRGADRRRTELLLGNIANLDAQIISQGLSALGITVHYHTVVGDNPQRLADALDIARRGRTSSSPPGAWAPPTTT